MKIVMLSYMTGADFAYSPGEWVEFDDAECARLVTVGGARYLTASEQDAMDAYARLEAGVPFPGKKVEARAVKKR